MISTRQCISTPEALAVLNRLYSPSALLPFPLMALTPDHRQWETRGNFAEEYVSYTMNDEQVMMLYRQAIALFNKTHIANVEDCITVKESRLEPGFFRVIILRRLFDEADNAAKIIALFQREIKNIHLQLPNMVASKHRYGFLWHQEKEAVNSSLETFAQYISILSALGQPVVSDTDMILSVKRRASI